MLKTKVMSVKQFMESSCNMYKLKQMYMRLKAGLNSERASRLTCGKQPLYYTSGGSICCGGDCVDILSYREGYGYTIINVGDRGHWYCCIHTKNATKYDDIVFYDGKFEEVYESLARQLGV